MFILQLRKKNEEKLLKVEHRNKCEGPSPILRKVEVQEKEENISKIQRKL